MIILGPARPPQKVPIPRFQQPQPLPSVRKFRIIFNGSGILYLKPKVGEFKSVDTIF